MAIKLKADQSKVKLGPCLWQQWWAVVVVVIEEQQYCSESTFRLLEMPVKFEVLAREH